MRPAATSLPAFKVPVGGGGAALFVFQLIRIHGQAHTASGITPIRTGFMEDAIKTTGLEDQLRVIDLMELLVSTLAAPKEDQRRED